MHCSAIICSGAATSKINVPTSSLGEIKCIYIYLIPKYIKLSGQSYDIRNLKYLKNGENILYPTNTVLKIEFETVKPDAVSRVYKLKQC